MTSLDRQFRSRSRASKTKPRNSPRGHYEKPVVPSPEVLAEITYDEYQRIRYRADKSLRLDPGGQYPVQLFHLGKYATEPVHIHVVESGRKPAR